MDYNYTGILTDIDTSLRHLNDSLRKLTPQPQPQPNQAKADFIREIAPKIALTIAPSGKVDFPSVIRLAASWYDEIEEYILLGEENKMAEPIKDAPSGYMSGGYYYEFQTPANPTTDDDDF